ncbi:MAG TPA: hypothetical protein VEG25_00230 [Burkholderiales bacterium]|nr:hypothetical protein [Burkholderiales bacterium]
MSKRHTNTIGAKLKGAVILGWLLATPFLIIALVTVLLILAFGFYEGRKAYWDSKVKEMCEKDGGVRIIEKVRISQADIDLLGRVGGKIGVPIKELAKPNAPVYAELKITDLREWNPRVSRSEAVIRRRVDKTVVARWVIYARSGGDFPSPSHGTSFSCPDLKAITSDLQPLFIVEGNS